MWYQSRVIQYKKTSVSCKNLSTESSLGWACLGRYLKEDNKTFYTPKNKYVKDFIRKTVHGGRLICLNRKFASSSFGEIIAILEKHYGSNLEISNLFEKYFDYFKKN